MHCFFVVIDEHESVIIIGLKVKHFFCDVEKVQIGDSDAQLLKYVYSFCPWYYHVPSQSSKRRVAAEKPSDVFSIKAELSLRISSCFSPLISSLQRAKAR